MDVEKARTGAKSADQLLVERVQQGDKKAFDILVLKYQQRLVNLVSRFISDRDEVLDVTQEAFIKAYRALPNFRGESAFYTWLYTIATNTAKNWLVSKGRRPSGIDVYEAEQMGFEPELQDTATPEQLNQSNQVQEAVISAIAALPEDLRRAITLRELEGLSYDEIAVEMECPVGTVRSRIFRARDAISKHLEPYLD